MVVAGEGADQGWKEAILPQEMYVMRVLYVLYVLYVVHVLYVLYVL